VAHKTQNLGQMLKSYDDGILQFICITAKSFRRDGFSDQGTKCSRKSICSIKQKLKLIQYNLFITFLINFYQSLMCLYNDLGTDPDPQLCSPLP
jgi:hypothetical protein